ncbi:MAG: hypothetical protein IE938_11475 [Pseudomonas balearica]|uniref:hypothetical protein n=1 Tax=Stutzerimonas balearica TaxID=74829 RepID=UPI00199F7430|nr:hypothetical protein [Stutzerimonas balearica]MBD3737057.1 hypothetical protein [Stutzerimonas balearica]MCZ4129269.1 hypothetical protein [Stutzerimonas balearica]
MSHLTQQQAVLDKRGACYRAPVRPSTAPAKNIQQDKGVTGSSGVGAFAGPASRARMPLLFNPFPMVNQAS